MDFQLLRNLKRPCFPTAIMAFEFTLSSLQQQFDNKDKVKILNNSVILGLLFGRPEAKYFVFPCDFALFRAIGLRPEIPCDIDLSKNKD